ncbi:unnamed protein product [Trifolium pratense]|uniref:Uncharacterized protein n=1 Tax=Trifolium pratense TaxID=57577 RepID=A0ACB0J1F0_TRIPR|nr:unnamed protein product [Trifolium pratense]
MEKKFLPLPPLRTSIYIQEPSCNSISEAEDEISSSSACVLESITSYSSFNFSFGNFHSESIPIKLIKAVKPQIEGCAIKIGEIACSLASFNISETSQSMNTTMKVKELEKKKPIVKLSIPSTFVEYSSELIKKSMEIIHEVDSFCNKIRSITSCVSHALEDTVHFNLNLVSLYMCFLLHRVNNTILTVETVFDPGGGVEPLSVATFGGTITLISSLLLIFRLIIVLAVEFSGEFAVTVFYPGGNRLTSLMRSISLLLSQSLQKQRNASREGRLEFLICFGPGSFSLLSKQILMVDACGSEECVRVLISVEITAAHREFTSVVHCYKRDVSRKLMLNRNCKSDYSKITSKHCVMHRSAGRA